MNETIERQVATIDKLIFVYAAGSGKLNALMDSAKKLLSLNGCSLCSITHGLAGEKNEWKNCQEEFGVPIDYLHNDEIPLHLDSIIAGRLPCILAVTGNHIKMLLTPEVLDRAKGSVGDLKGRLYTHASMNQLKFP